MSKIKNFVVLICLFLVAGFAVETSSAGKSKYGSNRSSSYKSSYSSSKPKYGSSNRSPSRPSSSSKYGRPSSSRPSSSSKSKYGSSSNKPKYGSSNNRPSTSSKKPSSSRKPSSNPYSSKAKTNRQQSSKKYVESKKAVNPPKTSYKTSSGKTVKIRASSQAVKTMRSKPSSYYAPAAREKRINVYVTNNYRHGYDYYNTQPFYHVGGGYSSAFWYMMMEWDAQRRARWLYHNQNIIERSAYERGMRDAAVAQEMARLKSSGASVNPNYIDQDFVDDPSLMYSQDYVEASYNPTVVRDTGAATALSVLLWLVVIFVIGFGVWFLFTQVRFGN